MSYRAIAQFWDGETCYLPGDAVPFDGATAEALVRGMKIEREPEKEPAPEPKVKTERKPRPRPAAEPIHPSTSEIQP